MNKKIFLLLLILFLTSGCTIDYNIEIYNNKVTETIDLQDKTTDSFEELKTKMYDLFNKYQVYDGINKTFDPYEKGDFYSFRSIEEYNFSDYNENIKPVSNSCRDISFVDDGKNITFQMLGYLKWFEKYDDLDELNIVIKSNHKVKEHNADETKRYTYIWHIDKENYKEKIPMIKLYSNEYVFDYNNQFIKKVVLICGIAGIILIVSFVVYKTTSKRFNKANEI